MNYWLLLEKSDETRISKGIDGYGSVRDMHTEEDFIIADAHKNGVRVKVKGPMLQGALMALLETIVKVEGDAISMN